jgi:membrane peptidoglycan carboxypeptidase
MVSENLPKAGNGLSRQPPCRHQHATGRHDVRHRQGTKKFSQGARQSREDRTTNDYRDAWFIGYTQVVTGIQGYDKPKPGGKGLPAGRCAPIWERFMRQALAARPAVDFPQPVGGQPDDRPATGFPAIPAARKHGRSPTAPNTCRPQTAPMAATHCSSFRLICFLGSCRPPGRKRKTMADR